MRERHNRTDKRCGFTAGGAAAVVFCLAGSPVGMAQTTPSQPPPSAPPMRNPLTPPSPTGASDKVKVDDNMIVDLHVNDEDLANVLQMLSIQSQKNIVTSRNVSAVVTANLYGVTFYEALDAILHVNGYGYIERGNFIYVYTLEELTQIEAAQRVRVSKVFRLNYLSGIDAAEFIQPLLSENGQIKTNGRAATFSDSGTMTGEDFVNESTLLVHDFEENIAEMERILKELDTRPSQVLIEATVLQTALTEANAFGVDFSVIGDMDFGDFLNLGGPLQVVDAMIDGAAPSGDTGQGVVSSAGGTAGPATFKLGIVQNDVAAFLRLLDEVSDTQILSRPTLHVLNRTTGRVLVGRKVGYLSTTSTDTATTQTVEFLDTGTQLVVRPFIGADGMIKMELKPKVSEAVIRNTTTAGGQAVTIPDEISNELTTTVMVRDGHTVVLGGLFRESTQASRRQVPFAGDLPIIGAAFRGHDDEVQRSEVIFMITPTIMADNVLIEQGRRAEAAVDQVRAGSRQGLLPWSRERRTSQMLVQAKELARQGDTEGALYKVSRALRLNPYQADAIALRERLLQQRSNWPERSMQHEIISGEIENIVGNRQGAVPFAPQFNPSPAPAPLPEAVVEVDDGPGVAWFQDDLDAGSEPANSGKSDKPAPSPTEQATVNEEPMSWITPEQKPIVPESAPQAQPAPAAVAMQQPSQAMPQQASNTWEASPAANSGANPSDLPASTTASSSSPASQSSSNTANSSSSGTQTWSTTSAGSTASTPASAPTAASSTPSSNPTTSAATPASRSTPLEQEIVHSFRGQRSTNSARPATAAPANSTSSPASGTAVASNQESATTASGGQSWIPGTADPAPAGGLKANPQQPQQIRQSAQPQPSASSPMWSSALAAALEESGESFESIAGEPAANTSTPAAQQGTKQAAAPQPGQELVWSPDRESAGGGNPFASFQTVWDLFRSYSERQNAARGNSTVTSVPTEGSNPK